MSATVILHDVPDELHDKLARRAAASGQSLQKFLLAELKRLAMKPSVDPWLARIRKRKSESETRLGADEILAQRARDRR